MLVRVQPIRIDSSGSRWFESNYPDYLEKYVIDIGITTSKHIGECEMCEEYLHLDPIFYDVGSLLEQGRKRIYTANGQALVDKWIEEKA